MKIAIDANEVLHGERAIHRYAVNLIRGLVRMSQSENHFELIYFRFRKSRYSPLEWAPSDRDAVRDHGLFFPGKLMRWAWENLQLPKSDFFCPSAVLFHAPGNFVPPRGKIPMVVTIHSTAHLHIPEAINPAYRTWYESFLKRVVENGDYFITVSESMKTDFINTFHVPERRVRVIPLGVGAEFSAIKKTEDELTLKRFGIRSPYILYVGGIQKNKNVGTLVEAFGQFEAKSKSRYQLVLVGDNNWGSQEVLDQVRRFGVADKVIMTGYLEQESQDLPALYRNASAFAFPSLWEGCASPPLEAMACGVPVIVSDILPLRESLKESAIYVDPYSAEKIAGKLLELFADDKLRTKMVNSGAELVKQMTWEKTALLTMKFYSDIVNNSL